jgi:hypothetical protein
MRSAAAISDMSSARTGAAANPVPAALRPLPYPYRALLAICSDLDLTPDAETYYECARFLNTTERTPRMGEGVGLEIGNTIYFDMAPDQFAYWNTTDAGRHWTRAMIASGHVDCLHSFGDLATTRAHAARALDELDRYGCRLDVWIDHAVAPTNLGADIMCGHGDVPGDPAYHADLTTAFGVRYVWRGRVTSVLGQNVPRTLGGIFTPRHPLASAATLARETVKGVLAHRGSEKYSIHPANRVLRPAALRDGRPTVEFLRSNPHWGGVSRGDTGFGLPEVLTGAMLSRLAHRGGTCVLYTHLGKTRTPQEPFAAPTRRALRELAAFQDRGEILVTTTRRLLDYSALLEQVRVDQYQSGGCTVVTITSPGDLRSRSLPLDGLTVYVDDPARTRVVADGRDVSSAIARNPPDATSRASVSIRWPRLEFPRV